MRIFISHASADKQIADRLDETLKLNNQDVSTFVATRPGDIRANENWLDEIERALESADAYIIVLTPQSILRPWVNFEAGAAWFLKKVYNRQLVFVRTQSLSTDEIPSPIESKQVYSLDDASQLQSIFMSLNLTLENPDDWAARFAECISENSDEPAWEGIHLQGVFYAWAGPMLGLQDLAPIPPPDGLREEIEKREYRFVQGNSKTVSECAQRRLAQLFATDKKTWRRPLIDRGAIYMVGFHKNKKV